MGHEGGGSVFSWASKGGLLSLLSPGSPPHFYFHPVGFLTITVFQGGFKVRKTRKGKKKRKLYTDLERMDSEI